MFINRFVSRLSTSTTFLLRTSIVSQSIAKRSFSITSTNMSPTMKALVYRGKEKGRVLEEVPKPTIKFQHDAIIKLTGTTICGTDLHISKGDVPACVPGTILGHEGIGIVEEAGSAVSKFKKGDKVLISCITSCGDCAYCKKDLQSHCTDGGWILGHLINGTQAEYVRIPHADHSLYNIESYQGKIKDEALLMLSDILPTGNEIGAVYGRIEEGDIVAVVGAGSVGISALIAAKSYNPSRIIMIDTNEERLKISKEIFGATDVINPAKVKDIKAEVLALTQQINATETSRNGLIEGVDVAIEAVGIPTTWETCQSIIAPGGRIANVGVHGAAVQFELQNLWIQNINVSTGLVNANTTSDLLNKIDQKKLDPLPLVTHHFKFSDVLNAYKVFDDSAKEKCIKVFLEFDN